MSPRDREIAEAHARLAALPTIKHERKVRDAMAEVRKKACEASRQAGARRRAAALETSQARPGT